MLPCLPGKFLTSLSGQNIHQHDVLREILCIFCADFSVVEYEDEEEEEEEQLENASEVCSEGLLGLNWCKCENCATRFMLQQDSKGIVQHPDCGSVVNEGRVENCSRAN